MGLTCTCLTICENCPVVPLNNTFYYWKRCLVKYTFLTEALVIDFVEEEVSRSVFVVSKFLYCDFSSVYINEYTPKVG